MQTITHKKADSKKPVAAHALLFVYASFVLTCLTGCPGHNPGDEQTKKDIEDLRKQTSELTKFCRDQVAQAQSNVVELARLRAELDIAIRAKQADAEAKQKDLDMKFYQLNSNMTNLSATIVQLTQTNNALVKAQQTTPEATSVTPASPAPFPPDVLANITNVPPPPPEPAPVQTNADQQVDDSNKQFAELFGAALCVYQPEVCPFIGVALSVFGSTTEQTKALEAVTTAAAGGVLSQDQIDLLKKGLNVNPNNLSYNPLGLLLNQVTNTANGDTIKNLLKDAQEKISNDSGINKDDLKFYEQILRGTLSAPEKVEKIKQYVHNLADFSPKNKASLIKIAAFCVAADEANEVLTGLQKL